MLRIFSLHVRRGGAEATSLQPPAGVELPPMLFAAPVLTPLCCAAPKPPLSFRAAPTLPAPFCGALRQPQR